MRHFIVVAETMHFGRAAQKLGMAQPPLSQSIKRLEIYLGVNLFDRSRRSVELTPSGRAFLHEARRTLAQAELARKMAVREALKTPELRVSFIGPALYKLLPPLIVGYRSVAPATAIKLFERPSPEQLQELEAGEFDVGFIAASTPRTDGIETQVMEQAPYVAAVPADGPFGERTSISLSELADQPFISPPATYAAQAPRTLAMFKNSGFMPHVAQEAIQTNTSLSLVGAGLGCSLVMATASLTGFRNVRFLDIDDNSGWEPWELQMVWRPARISERALDFVRFAKSSIQSPGVLGPASPMTKLFKRSEVGGTCP